MTVLAIFDDLGLAFADVMLSTDEPGGHISMPTTGHTSHLDTELALSPSRLVRKFFRFSHRGKEGVFLVAGTVKHIERLVHNIKKVKNQSHLLAAEYKSLLCLSDVHNVIHVACLVTEGEGYGQFEIVGIVDGATFARLYDENRALNAAPYFGTTKLAGSGAADLHRWIWERGVQYSKRAFANEPLDLKIARTIHTVPSLLLEEDTRSTLSTISKGVGGYYEAYYFFKDTIEPLDSVVTIFAAIKGKGRKSYLELRRVFFHRYVSDWLLVISMFNLPVKIYPGEEKSFPFDNFELFKIPPLLEEGNEPSWTLSRVAIEMNSAENFRLTLYREEEDEDKVSKRFSEGQGGRRLLSAKIINRSIVLSINRSELEYYLERFWSNHPENRAVTLTG